MDFKKMILAKTEERSKLVEQSKASENIDELRGINEKIDAINKDLETLRASEKQADESEARTDEANKEMEKRGADFKPGVGFKPVADTGKEEARAKEMAAKEERGKALLEGRSVTVASSNIVVPKYAGATINGTFQQISSLIDNVDVMPLNGGESYTQPYEIATPDGVVTAEGADATDTDVTFGDAAIIKSKIVAYSEVTEEVLKLPAADYGSLILARVRDSLRKKIAKQILVGDGTTNNIMGIFNSTTIAASSDLAITAIDNTTLDSIVYGYGGDESVEGTSVLLLSKADLAQFAAVRLTDGKKYYDIKNMGGYGTINEIPFIINSAATPLAKATAGGYCMAYGNLKNYQLALFSPAEIARSTDYKFKQGITANRGVVFVGGNVVSYNGFLRIKKGA